MQDLSDRRATILVDTAALIHNYRTLADHAAKATAAPPRLIAVVKANAYGHGLAIAVRAFLRAGCDFFGVATLEEALEVRKHAPFADILVLGYTSPRAVKALAKANITQTVFSTVYARALAAAATCAEVTVAVHAKLDVGMHRLGFPPESTEEILSAITQKGLLPRGLYTHFPVADINIPDTVAALDAFLACRDRLKAHGLSLFAHTAASAALLTLPESILDGVRPGLALYGIPPVPTALPLHPALSLFSHVVQIHDLPAGTPVGYGGAFITSRPARIGTVPIGYGDGIPRAFSGQTVRVFHQKNAFFAPVAGHICMDQLMLDLTDTPVTEGDAVQIFHDVANAAVTLGTIPYEVLSALGPRITRKELAQCSPFTKTEKMTLR